MGKLSPESERIARNWLCAPQGCGEAAAVQRAAEILLGEAALRHAVGILLAEAEAEVERLIAELEAARQDRMRGNCRMMAEDCECGLCVREREIERLQAVVDKLWQPMDTAPKDGTEILLLVERRAGISGKMLVGHWMPGGHCIEGHPPIDEGWYFWSGSMFDKASRPLRWMPLPEAAGRK